MTGIVRLAFGVYLGKHILFLFFCYGSALVIGREKYSRRVFFPGSQSAAFALRRKI